jgi:hypothetical protein
LRIDVGIVTDDTSAFGTSAVAKNTRSGITRHMAINASVAAFPVHTR